MTSRESLSDETAVGRLSRRFKSIPVLSLMLAFLLLISGCAASGVYHTVGSGETLWRICKTYGVPLQDVAEINDIKDPTEIERGRKIFIPGVSKRRKVVPFKVERASVERDQDKKMPLDRDEGRVVIEKDRFLWPVKGEVSSAFGIRNGRRHDGIDIKAPDGTPVRAADDGKVMYVNSSMRGYGNIIIMMHKDDFYTVYAHNDENLVKMGDKVAKGEIIASVGSTGNASTSHLHFEVRQGKGVRNPLFFLP